MLPASARKQAREAPRSSCPEPGQAVPPVLTTASQRLPVPRIRWGKKGWPGQVCHLPLLPLTLPTSQGLSGKGGFSVSLGVFCSLACSMPVPFTRLAPSPPLSLPSGIHLLQQGLQNARLERCPSCHCAQRSALGSGRMFPVRSGELWFPRTMAGILDARRLARLGTGCPNLATARGNKSSGRSTWKDPGLPRR